MSLCIGELCLKEVYDEKLGFSKFYTSKDELVILVSPGYGGGWSSWAGRKHSERILMDASIIRFFYDNYVMNANQNWRKEPNNVDAMKKFLEKNGITDIFMGGLYQLKLEFIPKGKIFRIKEYDGYESVEYFNIARWIVS